MVQRKTGIKIGLFAFAWAVSCVVFSGKAFADATTQPLLHQSDMTYLGSFRLPSGQRGMTNGTFEYAGALTSGNVYDDPVNGKSLFMTGYLEGGYVSDIASIAQVKIPSTLADQNTTSPDNLPVATIVQGFDDPSNGKQTQALFGTGHGNSLVYGGKLIGTTSSDYDAGCGQSKSAWVAPINFSQKSQASGPYQFNSPVGARWVAGGYLALVPPEWQSLLGGKVVSGDSVWSIVSCGSPGPALHVIDADALVAQPSASTNINSTPLVYYEDGTHSSLGLWSSNVCGQVINGKTVPCITVTDPHGRGNYSFTYEDGTMRVLGMIFPDGTRSALFFGSKGMGPQCYGSGGASGGDCYDPDNEYKGNHAYPYTEFVWAYDANDFLAVKNGTKNPWDVVPYTGWAFKVNGDGDGGQQTGVSWDAATRRAYVVVAHTTSDRIPTVHVYQIGTPTPDTTPPTSPTNLSATATSQSSITVSWTAATDDVGVTGYQVERCTGLSCTTFANVGNPTASPFVDSGLTASTGYSYHVRAVDGAGNMSGWSNVVGATTQAPDTTSPTAPASLTATASSSSQINLTWTASTDNVGVTGYKVERCQGASCTTFTQVGTPSSNSFSDSGLSASTLYRYQVRATDAAGNNSSYSNIAQASTPVAPPTPTFVSEYETAWNSATSPKTTSNFSVQTGDILVAYAVNESSGSTIDTPPIGTLTGTWTLKQTISATNFTYLRLWTMQVSSNQSNVNVSFTNGGGNFGADVLHFRNASGVGVTAQANSATGNPTLTLNGVGDNSSIVMVNGDWSAKTGARTYNTTQAGAFTETSAYADGSSYGVEAGYYGNAGTAGNKTIGITAPTGMTWALAAIEVKGSGTGGSGDTTPPTSPTNLAASATSSSSVTVSWTAATDDVGVTGYQVERCSGTGCSTFTQVGTPTASPFVDSGLTASTFYNYHVRAVDAAGNVSGWSNVVGATTQSGSGGGTACNTVNVSSVPQLVNAVNAANSNPSCSTMILIADGTYTLSDMLPISAPNMTVKSQSENRDAVILQGDAMTSSASVKMIFRVDANNFTVENMTLQRVGWHLIQVVGENNRDNFIARNIVFRNAWEQMLKVTYVDTSSVGSDNGLVENSLFEFTSGQAGQYYTGGIDAHNAKNWVVRGNTFKNIISPSGSTAEHAIHFWSNSEDTLVEKNLIINCDRGIGFGLVQGRGHLRGIIRNNMIYHASGNGSFADVAIEADESPNTQIYNNTIFMQNSYANAIEYRWPLSSGIIIRNNLTNKAIQARDGATGTTSNNITNAQSTWFTNVSQGDLHLANGATSANNAGTSISGLTDDYDGNTRPQGGGIDVGADEYVSGGSSVSSCNTVTTTNFSQAAYNAYGAPFDAFQTSTNLLDAKCNSTDTHTINLTTGITGDTTRIVYTKGYYYDPVTTGWTQYSGTCNGALNGEWCQGSISATITNPNISTASASNPTYLVGMTCSVQGGGWKCGCRDTTCSNFYWQVQGAGQ